MFVLLVYFREVSLSHRHAISISIETTISICHHHLRGVGLSLLPAISTITSISMTTPSPSPSRHWLSQIPGRGRGCVGCFRRVLRMGDDAESVDESLSVSALPHSLSHPPSPALFHDSEFPSSFRTNLLGNKRMLMISFTITISAAIAHVAYCFFSISCTESDVARTTSLMSSRDHGVNGRIDYDTDSEED